MSGARQVSLIDPDGIAGLGVDPDGIDQNAGLLKTIGACLVHAGAAALRTWQRLPASYASTGAERLYDAMQPVQSNSQLAGDALEQAAKALVAYAHTARGIVKRAEALRTEARTFVHGTGGYPKETTRPTGGSQASGYGQASVTYDHWDEDPQAVAANEGLRNRADGLQAELLEAQETCATAIRGAVCLAPTKEAEVAAAAHQLRSIDWLWNPQLAADEQSAKREGGCAAATANATGSLYDGAVNSLHGAAQSVLGFVGWDGDRDFTAEQRERSWTGLAHVVSLVSPVVTVTGAIAGIAQGREGWDRFVEWEKGDAAVVTGLTALAAFTPPADPTDPADWKDFGSKWAEDPWEAIGETGTNIASLLIPGAALKVLRGGEVAAVGTRAGEVFDSASVRALQGLDRAALLRVVDRLDEPTAARMEAELAKTMPDVQALHDLGTDHLRVDLTAAAREHASALITKSGLSEQQLTHYVEQEWSWNPKAVEAWKDDGTWPQGLQVPSSKDVLNAAGGVDWTKARAHGYTNLFGVPFRHRVDLQPGVELDRYGSPRGVFTSPVDPRSPWSYPSRSLPYVEDPGQYHRYVVVRPFSELQEARGALPPGDLQEAVESWIADPSHRGASRLRTYAGTIKRAFGEPGGGTQVELPLSPDLLQRMGFLKDLTP